NKAHFLEEKEAIHLILTGIGDDIYSTVDACQTAQEMWEAIERLQQGESLNIQDTKTNLFWEFKKFTSHDRESMESYYTRFYKLMNETIINNLTVTTMQVNVQFLQQLQPKWSRSHKSQAPSPKPSIPSRSHTSTRHNGKEIAKPITPLSEIASEEDNDPKQAQRDKDMQKNLALIAKYFKKIYKPTNNNLRTSSNSKNKNVDTTPRKPKRVKDSAYHKEKMLLCKQAEQGVPLQAEQYDWLADTDEEVNEQELEAHYSYMAKIQEVPNAESGTDSEQVEQIVQLILFIVDSGCTKHMTGNLKLLCNFVEKSLGTVRFGNDQFAPILGYGDLVQGNVTINRVYYVEGLNHNLFSVGQFCDVDLEVVLGNQRVLLEIFRKALNYDNPDRIPQRQDVSSSADADVPSQQELDILFGPLYDEFFNAGSNPSTNVQSTLAPSTHTNVHAEENDNDQAEEGEQLQDAEFTNPFCAPAQEECESSSHNIGNSNVHTFNQPHVFEYRWIKDHPLEQVHRNLSRPVQTRRQLATDPEMCMFTLTMSTIEPKNIKEAMADSAWIEAMQDELHQFEMSLMGEKKFFLGLQIYQSPSGIFINQAKYTLEILHKHGIDKGQSIGTPMATKPKLDADMSGNPVDQTDYHNVDHAGCIDSRKSTSGGIQFLGDKLVSWMSKKQNCTALSSAEAEYVALSTSCAQVMWMRTQLQDYVFNYNQIPLYFLRYDGDECDKGRMPTKIDLTLEQSQQGVSNDVLVAVCSSL
nr:copia protein [Tanacetum cinerariifolium]